MARIALVFLMGGLLLGASRCEDDDRGAQDAGQPDDADGSAGSTGGGERCGAMICERGEECCNESCGICTEPGEMCTLQLCHDGGGERDGGGGAEPDGGGSGTFCGGIANLPCPGAGMCVDDARDSCDPENGGADCGGVCACNATALCDDGLVFDAAPEVCACVPDDDGAERVQCGPSTCAAGEVCCNESCGICTEPGGVCIQQACDDDPGESDPRPGQPCELSCEPGQHCEYIEVQCVQAPCPPQPECVDDTRCGGFGGFGCPGAGRCIDDPNDDCDPQNGGADCGGICVCDEPARCTGEVTWNASASVCACEGEAGAGEACGDTTCPEGLVCCNASCGLCAEPEAACIQIACL
jgi:hypothetical protein